MRYMPLRIMNEPPLFLGGVIIVPITFYRVLGTAILLVHRDSKGDERESSDRGW
jgi:hypothetical protein